MRLFFALPLPPDAKERLRPILEATRKAGGDGVTFTKLEQLHFTLAFLGEQPEAREAAAAGREAREAGARGGRTGRVHALGGGGGESRKERAGARRRDAHSGARLSIR